VGEIELDPDQKQQQHEADLAEPGERRFEPAPLPRRTMEHGREQIRRDGPEDRRPRNSPATISPTTLGGPRRRATVAPSRAARMITASCTSSGRKAVSAPAARSIGRDARTITNPAGRKAKPNRITCVEKVVRVRGACEAAHVFRP
jgi:hypothetical protein